MIISWAQTLQRESSKNTRFKYKIHNNRVVAILLDWRMLLPIACVWPSNLAQAMGVSFCFLISRPPDSCFIIYQCLNLLFFFFSACLWNPLGNVHNLSSSVILTLPTNFNCINHLLVIASILYLWEDEKSSTDLQKAQPSMSSCYSMLTILDSDRYNYLVCASKADWLPAARRRFISLLLSKNTNVFYTDIYSKADALLIARRR
jgi:hypothetical protein